MRNHRDVFHVAIPAHDLDASQAFYVGGLGCKLARRYADRITLDFFGDQVVCHRTERPAIGSAPLSLYPRHFGVTFRDASEFAAVVALAHQRDLPVFAEVGRRFPGMVEAHDTFVLVDPAENLIEFKHYDDPRMMY